MIHRHCQSPSLGVEKNCYPTLKETFRRVNLCTTVNKYLFLKPQQISKFVTFDLLQEISLSSQHT